MSQPQQDAFQDPRAVGEPGPTMSELAGRTIAVVVRSYDPTATYQAPGDKELKSRPCVVGDLYVFGDQPLNYGGSDSSTDPKPPTHTVACPAVFPGRYFAQVNVVSALRDAAPVVLDAQGGQSRGPGDGGPVIGLVERSTFGGKPWNLTKLNPKDPARGQEFHALRAAAGMTWGQAQAGMFQWRTHADGVAIMAAHAAQAAPYGNWPQGAAPVNPQNPQQGSWGQGLQDPQQAPGYAQATGYPTAPQYVPAVPASVAPAMDPAYAAFLAQQAAAAAPPAPVVDPAFAAWQAQQAAAAAAIPVAPAGAVPQQAGPPVAEDVPPVGYEAIWSTLPAEQKAAIRAAVAGSNAAAAQARPNPY